MLRPPRGRRSGEARDDGSDGDRPERERGAGGAQRRPARRRRRGHLRAGWRQVAGPGPVVVDGAGIEAFDTAGAWAIATLRRRLEAEGVEVRIEGLAPERAALLETVERSLPTDAAPAPAPPGFVRWLGEFGQGVAEGWETATELLSLLGAVLVRLAGNLVHPTRLRLTSVVYHMQQAGLNAVPIAALMAFLIGVVLAYMGAVQLRQFGAEIFVVDLIAIAVLRELGILLDRDHRRRPLGLGLHRLDRLDEDARGDRRHAHARPRSGADPRRAAHAGAALHAAAPRRRRQLRRAARRAGHGLGGARGLAGDVRRPPLTTRSASGTILVGIIKAPFFALVIALIGCHHGLKVGGNAESLGKLTSASVVLAIFLVIVLDAIFAIFFATVNV